MSDELTPILIGCGQHTLKEQNPDSPESIYDMMEMACRDAAENASIGEAIWSKVDAVYGVNSISAAGSDMPVAMAERLGSKPEKFVNTTIGGNTPQWLVGLIGEEINQGKIQTALICGGKKGNKKYCWGGWKVSRKK